MAAEVDFDGNGTFENSYNDMKEAREAALGENNRTNTVIRLQADWIAGTNPDRGFIIQTM